MKDERMGLSIAVARARHKEPRSPSTGTVTGRRLEDHVHALVQPQVSSTNSHQRNDGGNKQQRTALQPL